MINPLIVIVLIFVVVVLPMVVACYYWYTGAKTRVACWVISSICAVVIMIGFFGRIVHWQGASIHRDHRGSGTITSISNYNDTNYISVTIENLYVDSEHVTGQMRVNIRIKNENSIFVNT